MWGQAILRCSTKPLALLIFILFRNFIFSTPSPYKDTKMMFKLACLALAALVTADGAGTIRPLHHQDLCLDVSGEHFIDGNVVMV